jgi:hypothetical protein
MRNAVHVGIIALAIGLGAGATSRAAGPDIVGFTTGMPAKEAYEMLKKYAGPARQVAVGHQNFPELNPTPIIHQLVMSDGNRDTSAEVIELDLTLPPSPQTVWRVVRALRFQPGKEMLAQDLIATLRKKYGPEYSRPPMAANLPGTWWYTADGARASLPPGVPQFGDCNAVGPSGDFDQANLDMPNPMLIRPLPALNPFQEPCRTLVKVSAMLQQSSAELAHGLIVAVADLALEKRAHEATVAKVAGANEAAQKQVIDTAHSQEKPKL